MPEPARCDRRPLPAMRRRFAPWRSRVITPVDGGATFAETPRKTAWNRFTILLPARTSRRISGWTAYLNAMKTSHLLAALSLLATL